MATGLVFPVWPGQPCPPGDASPVNGVFYRTVSHNPPTAEDFLSWHELGKKVKPSKVCQSCGVSMQPTREAAEHQRELYPWGGQYIAEGTLTPAHGLIKHTPSGQLPSHHTWWCYTGVARHEAFDVI